MNQRGMKKELVVKLFSLLITSVVLMLLIFSGPAEAFTIGLTIGENYAPLGKTISFTGSVNINSLENLPINNLKLSLDGPEDINCLFLANGSIVSGCKGLTIELLGNASYRKGHGYGYYGYGYDFGYGYGYTNGTLLYNFTLNSTNYTQGIYETGLSVFIDGDEFFNPGDSIYILEDINITDLPLTPSCAYEDEIITLKANITGSIDEVWAEVNNGTFVNYSTSNTDDIYYAEVKPGQGNFSWRFAVKDITGNIIYGNWNSMYVISRTTLDVFPATPNGLDGWYTVEPVWTLSNPDANPVYYKWNGNPRIEYTGPFGIENISNPYNVSAGTMKLSYAGNTTCEFESWTQKIFYVDLTAPLITGLVPANNSETKDNMSEISAYLDEVYQSNSGIDDSSIIMKLDGAVITPVVTKFGLDRRLVYYPSSPLSEGWHEVYVYAKDKAGSGSEVSWRFLINSTAVFDLIVRSPIEGVYDSKRIPFNITTSEEVEKIEYALIDDRVLIHEKKIRWKRLCRNCEEYGYYKTKLKTLKEGQNNITIRATDKIGNVVEINKTIFIDSKKPRVSKIRPRRNQVVNGSYFYIKYTENNLQNITLIWNETKLMDNCTSGRNQECTTFADLSSHNGEEIEYWYELSDVARTIETRKTKIKIDTTSPNLIINSPINSSDYERKVPFNITITEDVKLEYYDYQDRNPRWRRLCGNCDSYGNEKRVKTRSFKRGFHDILIRATDKAGNSDIETLSFNVDY